MAKQTVIKRSLVLLGHKTSVSLEDAFWQAFRDLAKRRGLTLSQLGHEIDGQRAGNMSSAIRLAVLADYAAQLADARADLETVRGAVEALPQQSAERAA